jgi:alkylated DNA repair dioxygenase AlkB
MAAMTRAAHDGRSPIELPGFSYLPGFIDLAEADALIEFFAQLGPLWEQRHRAEKNLRPGEHSRRLTRPVYWLGAWQFACLGYYAEPDHREDRCVRAEPFPPVMQDILDRLRPTVEAHDSTLAALPNTCLINYYGRELGDGPPRDYARLRMHRDAEPGPVVMFSIGQPGLLEFVDRSAPDVPELALWLRHRSVSILSGPDFKDRLYHRITEVRHGRQPALETRLEGFEVRRVSVSFRTVPEQLIANFDELSPSARDLVRDYVEQLARHSAHFEDQLERCS